MKLAIASMFLAGCMLASVSASAEETAPPATGTVPLYLGLSMTAAGIGGGLGATALSNNSQYLHGAMALEIVSGVVGTAGSVLALVGCVQSFKYEDWASKHPVLSGLQVSPTAVGYHLTF